MLFYLGLIKTVPVYGHCTFSNRLNQSFLCVFAKLISFCDAQQRMPSKPDDLPEENKTWGRNVHLCGEVCLNCISSLLEQRFCFGSKRFALIIPYILDPDGICSRRDETQMMTTSFLSLKLTQTLQMYFIIRIGVVIDWV